MNYPFQRRRIEKSIGRKADQRIILTKNLGTWYHTSGSMGTKKRILWTYNGYIMGKLEVGKMLSDRGIEGDGIMMVLIVTASSISWGLPYHLLESTGSIGATDSIHRQNKSRC